MKVGHLFLHECVCVLCVLKRYFSFEVMRFVLQLRLTPVHISRVPAVNNILLLLNLFHLSIPRTVYF